MRSTHKIVLPSRVDLRFFHSELSLLFGRFRNLAGLAGLACVPILVAVSVKLSDNPEGPPFISHISQNGTFIVLTSLAVCLPLFFPIGVGAVSADAIAGEANTGTLRYLLSVPVRRGGLLWTKYAAVCVFIATMIGSVVVSGTLIGLIVFPHGDVTLLSGTEIPLLDASIRVLGAAGYVGLILMGIAALGVFLSTLTEQPLGAMIALVAIVVASEIISAISSLSAVHPYLLSTHYLSFSELMRAPVYWEPLWHGSFAALSYIAIFFSAAWARFSNREVTA